MTHLLPNPGLRRLALVPVVATMLVGVAGCGSGDDDTSDAGSSPPAASAAVAEFSQADVEFSQGMIAHHEQAIEMAEIALDPSIGASPEVVDLATRIRAAQDPEIVMMTGWLNVWDQPLAMDTSEGHEMSSMAGMMTAEQMDALAVATGAEFDTEWLAMMIAHHEGAVEQATEVKTKGSNPDVLALADQIIANQQAEITEMQQLASG